MNQKVTSIKVLNIAQPHAHNVIFNGKNVENRSKVSHDRGTIAIYASATYKKDRFTDKKIKKEDCSFGCIVGFVDIVDCIVKEEVTQKTKKWFFGPYGYVFENVRVLKKPIQVKPPKGAIIWWTLSGEEAKKCLEQIPPDSFRPVTKIAPDKSKPKAKVKTPRTILIPSNSLASLVGDEPTKFNAVIDKLFSYLEENDLLLEKKKGVPYFKTDEKLKKIFEKEVISFEESAEKIYANLYFPK